VNEIAVSVKREDNLSTAIKRASTYEMTLYRNVVPHKINEEANILNKS
jgi:hypothetical protein